MFKSDSIAKLAPALLKAQKNMGAALKDSKNPFFKSKFADLNAVIDAAVPVLNEQGIVVLQNPTTLDFTTGPKVVLQTMLLHESGEYITSETDIVVAKQNDPQALGSAISYARRYGLQAAVTLKAEDDDGEANYSRTPKTSTTESLSTKGSASAGSASAGTNLNNSTSTTATPAVAYASAKEALTDVVNTLASEKPMPSPFKRTRPTTKSSSEDIM